MTNYYGLPQEQWDLLVMQAEDLFYDEQIGQHIVGIYPAGPRIYGLESEPSGLLCLYVDNIHNLLNPLAEHHGFQHYTLGNHLHSITYADFFNWIRWVLIDRYYNWGAADLLDVLPCNQLQIHEDDSITPIIDNITRVLEQTNYPMNSRYNNYSPLVNRTMLILRLAKQFSPNINPEWDNVFELTQLPISVPEEIIQMDMDMRAEYLNNHAPLCLDYIDWIKKETTRIRVSNNSTPNQQLLEEISKECIKLFSSQI